MGDEQEAQHLGRISADGSIQFLESTDVSSNLPQSLNTSYLLDGGGTTFGCLHSVELEVEIILDRPGEAATMSVCSGLLGQAGQMKFMKVEIILDRPGEAATSV